MREFSRGNEVRMRFRLVWMSGMRRWFGVRLEYRSLNAECKSRTLHQSPHPVAENATRVGHPGQWSAVKISEFGSAITSSSRGRLSSNSGDLLEGSRWRHWLWVRRRLI